MATLFTKLIQGELPSHKIAENDEFFAFLDISPLAEGHTLVVPKKEVDEFFDLEDALLARMILFSKQVAHAIKKAIPCKRVAVAVIGLEVPHAHIHLIPINKEMDMTLNRPRLKQTTEELAATAASIRAAL